MASMNHRIEQFRKAIHYSERKLSLVVSPSAGYIHTYMANGGSMTSYTLELLARKFPELNMDWVITGRGSMFCPPAGPAAGNVAKPVIKEQQAPALS